MKITAAALLLAASLAAPAAAHADCRGPGHDRYTAPVPAANQGLAIKVTDLSTPAAMKNTAVTAGFTAKDEPVPSPVEPLPMPLPFGSQNVPPGLEVYCPNAVWVLRRCHQCVADPAHKCWDR